MQTHKNVNLAPESFRRSTVPRRLKHRARRRRRILCLLPVILVFGVLAAALLRFTPAFAYADIFPAQATTRRTRTKTESLSAATHGRRSPATRFRKPAGDATPPSLSAP